MFKRNENGFSLVELSVAAAVAVGLAVVAVTVVSGTAASVSEKGSSAASVESCTISQSLANSGTDIEPDGCAPGLKMAKTFTPGSAVGWGFNGNGQTNAPSALTDIIDVTASGWGSAYLRSNGVITAVGSFPSVPAKYQTPPAIKPVKIYATAGTGMLILLEDGTLDSFGSAPAIPASLKDPATANVVKIGAGSAASHALALQSNGKVVGFGSNGSGQATVPSGYGKAKDVGVGVSHSVIVKDDGTVLTWGTSTQNNAHITPAALTNPDTAKVKAIFTNYQINYALKEDGTLVRWGDWRSGCTDPGDVVEVALGSGHTLFLRGNNTITLCTDRYNYGLGSIPSYLTNGSKTPQKLIAGQDFVIALYK
jgi:hypothetical protein